MSSWWVDAAGTSLELICPDCTRGLEGAEGALSCPQCRHIYPVIAGIPDLRHRGDAYLTLDEDRAKAQRLADVGGDFQAVQRAYWRMTPEVPPELAARYMAATEDGPRRGDRHLNRLGPVAGPLLDIGCGTGGLLVAAARRGIEPVGTDIALRWLVIAARHLSEQGVDARLFAADGARLPLRDRSVGAACCVEVLEHAQDPAGLLRSCHRLVRDTGVSYVVTANRYSLAPEPTVRLWGVGFLPRRWAPRYVRWRRSTRYQHFRPVGIRELRSLVAAADGTDVGPGVLPAPPRSGSAIRRAADRSYQRLLATPRGRTLLGPIAPYLEVIHHGDRP